MPLEKRCCEKTGTGRNLKRFEIDSLESEGASKWCATGDCERSRVDLDLPVYQRSLVETDSVVDDMKISSPSEVPKRRKNLPFHRKSLEGRKEGRGLGFPWRWSH